MYHDLPPEKVASHYLGKVVIEEKPLPDFTVRVEGDQVSFASIIGFKTFNKAMEIAHQLAVSIQSNTRYRKVTVNTNEINHNPSTANCLCEFTWKSDGSVITSLQRGYDQYV